MAAHQHTLSLPAAPTAVTAARYQAVDAIADWDVELDDDVVHTAELVISELVTNSVRHTATGQVSMEVRIVEAVLRIEVCDSSPVLPEPGLPDGHSENGRGLFLVAAHPAARPSRVRGRRGESLVSVPPEACGPPAGRVLGGATLTLRSPWGPSTGAGGQALGLL